MSEKQAQTRAARRQAMVKERRTAHRQQYDRNKREMLIIKGISISSRSDRAWRDRIRRTSTMFEDRNLNQAPDGVKVFSYASANHIEGNIDYSAQPDYKGEIPPAGGAQTARRNSAMSIPSRSGKRTRSTRLSTARSGSRISPGYRAIRSANLAESSKAIRT